MCDNIKTKHHRNSGVYAREMEFPKDYYVQSHKHIFDHMSILAKGEVDVTVDGVTTRYTAPSVIEVKKQQIHHISAIEDSVWFCVHNDENFQIEEINIKRSK